MTNQTGNPIPNPDPRDEGDSVNKAGCEKCPDCPGCPDQFLEYPL